MKRRTATLLAIAAASAICCDAQTVAERPGEATEKALLTRLFASNNPADLAWGAYLAANYQQKEFIPFIIPLLGYSDPKVPLIAIDSLIRLRAEVPFGALDAYNGPQTSLLVLLAQDPKRNAGYLLRHLDQFTNDNWKAANAILLTSPPPGYAARLLSRLTLRMKIQVWDEAIGYEDPMCGYYAINKPLGDTSAYPPIFFHSLRTLLNTTDWTRIGTGPEQVFFRRQATPQKGGGCADKDRDSLKYLQYLARLDLVVPAAQAFHWTNEPQFHRDAEDLISRIQASVDLIRTELVRRNLLTTEESVMGPSLTVQIVDQRKDKSRPLPPFEWRLDH